LGSPFVGLVATLPLEPKALRLVAAIALAIAWRRGTLLLARPSERLDAEPVNQPNMGRFR